MCDVSIAQRANGTYDSKAKANGTTYLSAYSSDSDVAAMPTLVNETWSATDVAFFSIIQGVFSASWVEGASILLILNDLEV